MTASPPDNEAIFHAARDIPDPDRRRGYVREACGGDETLIAHVEALLAAADAPDRLLDRSPAGDAAATTDQPTTEGPGIVIGPYKPLEQIGEGGFGVVFMAEQTGPVRRKVALKILKPGMDSRQVVARFEAERQALAIMDHPNIAKVFDGGATASGRPYFVMELVRGVPITDFCDQNHLSVRERLLLFVPVCQAVQHAHQKGIIHRDLKPTNVLVTLHDGVPVPKVIDFGIAKATGQPLTERTLFTGFAQMVGTPLYMSPEQAEMSGLDVDTRADVYALGVLLYELLTGTTPFDRERFKTAGYDEIRRIIREEEPVRPSTRVSTLGQAAIPVSAGRRSDPRGLRRLFRGELDWIVMRCLEKDRNRRYEAAGALAADVQRYLNDEPVQACPPSAWYRFRKLACRNRRALVTASAFTLASLVGVGALAVSTALVWEANKDLKESVDRERREAYFQRITVAHRELSIDNLAAALRALGECPEDLRGWEWYYLMRLCKVDPLVIRDKTGVHGVAFSSDGERLASAAADGTVRIWNSKTGEIIREFHAHDKAACAVAFHPDDRHLVSAGMDGWAKVWDLATGQEVFRAPSDANRPNGAAYTVAFRPPDGRHLATGKDGVVSVWDWKNGQPVHTFPGHEFHSTSVAFSRDGLRLATAGLGPSLWDAQAGGPPLRTFPAHTHPVSALAFSPNGERLASASFDRSVKLWDTTTGELLRRFLHTGNVDCVAFSLDGQRLASAGEDKTVRVWDTASGREVLGLRGHTGRCGCVTFSPDGWRLASAGKDGTIRIWNATPLRGGEGQEARTFTGHDHEIRNVVVSPTDGQWVASAGDGPRVKVWDAATGRVALDFPGPATAVFSMAWHPNGQRLATAGGDGRRRGVKVWDARDGRELLSISAGENYFSVPFTAVAFSPDGHHLVTAKVSGAVQVWDAETGREVVTLGTHSGGDARGVTFSRDGRHLASAADGEVKLWDATRLTEKRERIPPIRGRVPGPSLNVAFSPDSRTLATGGEEYTVKIWEVQTGRELATLRGHGGDVYTVAFSPDGRWVASAGEDSTVKVWDAHNDYRLVRSFRGHTSVVASLAFASGPDGLLLVSGSRDHTVKVWDVSKLEEEPK